MTTTQAIRSTARSLSKRRWQVGVAASLMLTASPVALHAEISNAELAKEIAELKAQIRSLKGGVAEAKSEARRSKKVVVAPGYVPPPVFSGLPPGATPVYATLDKKMIFGALTITPGGFIAMEGRYANKTDGGGIGSFFNNIPFNASGFAHSPQTRFEARQTRPALLIESPISKSMIVSGYAELDFLGGGTTANYNQTNSFVPRIRHLYAALDNSDYGLHVLAGQTWSLVTLNSKGITPRNEVLPPNIDPSYLPGFEYARIPQIRITKDLFDKKLWLSLDAEASVPAGINNGACTSLTGVITASAATGVSNGNCLISSTGGNLGQTNETTNFGLNKIPDILAKAAYEAKIADRDIHLEVTGVYRNLYDNVNYLPGGAAPAASTFAANGGFASSTNYSTNAYGIGAGIIVPLLPKKLDFQAQGLIGRGIGRYTATGLPDATVNALGKIAALGTSSSLAGFTYHVTPSIDLYLFAGFEQVNRNFSEIGGVQTGYGTTGLVTGGALNNYGCNNEGGTCTGQTHRIWEIMPGFWDKLYKGSFGEVRVGMQYGFVQRQSFGVTTNANGIGTAAAPLVAGRTNEQMVLTSFRYYPFQ